MTDRTLEKVDIRVPVVIGGRVDGPHGALSAALNPALRAMTLPAAERRKALGAFKREISRAQLRLYFLRARIKFLKLRLKVRYLAVQSLRYVSGDLRQ
ncbi:MAG: hypothetical protein RLO06_16910 [Parvibaculum sp.]